jgi:3-oxoadipate enol-lactonase
MPVITSDDAEIFYQVLGDGPPVVLLHPFPAHHEFWLPAAQALASRYRLILPDLRGHGESGIGQGPALMTKHAADIARICDREQVGRAVFAGVSIGGYALFECWRQYRGRIAALILCNTRAQADTPEARAARIQSASDVIERGTEPFIDGLLARAFGQTTLATRPDLVGAARRMALKMSPEDISLVQQGMAERPDSVPTLKTVNIPALVVAGEEDSLTPVADAEFMRQNLPDAQIQIIPRTGHFAVFEKPGDAGLILRQFLDTLHAG